MTYAQDYYAANKEKMKRASREYYAKNREHCLAVRKSYAKRNPAAVLANVKRWQKANPDKKNASTVATRRRKNGFVGSLFQERLSEQGGKCAICAKEMTVGLSGRAACGDHCHETREPRGILCKRCNLLLGHARDNEETLINAIAYLRRWKRTA